MNWSGNAAFNAAADEDFTFNGDKVGEIREAQGFSFVRVYGAGHMVPRDQPAATLAMVNKFILGTAWSPAAQPPPPTRYHCCKTTLKCIEASAGHSSMDKCAATCTNATAA